jgi:NAD(P)-dependent dehydrogenase (short-subunit alcohol dehydrogenase family)
LRKVLIAGATSALGSKVARKLSADGYELVLLGRDELKLSALQKQLSNHSTFELFDANDMTSDFGSKVQALSGVKGDLYGLVSFLGTLTPKALIDTSLAEWQKSLTVNLLANVELLRGFSACLFSGEITRRVAFISSVAATRGDLGLAAYAASKAALESLVRSAAVELSRKNIAVNAVRLGLVSEGMGEDIRSKIGTSAFSALGKRYPLGLGSGDEVISAVQFLLSQDSAWMTGSTLSIDGGYAAT